MSRNFMALLEARWGQAKSVCIGLDIDFGRIRGEQVVEDVAQFMFDFNRRIIDETFDLVCAYKPNIAFYEGQGLEGLTALIRTIAYINEVAPEIPVILDAKRADIGKTNAGYAKAAFDFLEADAITVNPYFGRDALEPFLSRTEKGIIVLCRTSNPGAAEFQDILLMHGHRLYEEVASHIANSWNENGNCAVVVGATYPDELAKVRKIVGEMPILIPGIGTQGGDLEKTVKAGNCGRLGRMIINSSSAIIYSDDPREETANLHRAINSYR